MLNKPPAPPLILFYILFFHLLNNIISAINKAIVNMINNIHTGNLLEFTAIFDPPNVIGYLPIVILVEFLAKLSNSFCVQ